jgi:hypothetical protein
MYLFSLKLLKIASPASPSPGDRLWQSLGGRLERAKSVQKGEAGEAKAPLCD